MPNGKTNAFSECLIALARVEHRRRPLKVRMGTALCNTNIKLKTNTIISDAPNPTKPLISPAKIYHRNKKDLNLVRVKFSS